MPLDIFVNEQLDSQWDDVGDIKTVRGSKYVQQNIVIAIIEGVGLHLDALTPDNIEAHRGDIESTVESLDSTSDNATVTVTEIDGQSVTYSIQTREVELSITTE